MTLISIGWFLLALMLSNVATRLLIDLDEKKGNVDQPDRERKIHKTPVPHSGGLAVYFALAIILMAVLASSDTLTQGLIGLNHYLGFLIGGAVLMFGGHLDDRYELSPKVSILFPVVAALCVIGFGVEITKLTNPLGGVIELAGWQSDLLVFVWLMGVMYTTKLLDGLDGLATGVTGIGAFMIMLLSLSAAYYQPDVALLALIVLGVWIGFWVLNFNPARIFLGEGGSTFVGFTLGTLAVISGGKLATALLVIAIPIFDVAWQIIRRFRVGGLKQVFQGDRLHLHFRLYDLGWSQRKVILLYYAVAIAFGVSTLFLQSYQKLIALGTLVMLMVVVVWIISNKKYERPTN
ncbi:undecaprenyl/decaprenyl-phosphate alpha-N-acetylglucosaminyl 1-phosphate transferase [Patescibacteria group bacterium]|nr:undecaprenyl/decaprenyl-phosphate alpha-N-acetylglucosaminyl 1-phosphate transferase [Patescibacteria group bacterium]MBU1906790.1 undecaprenyl/decaprenyl-phosphate alpha-N-acetylglucosaminyl 1-phosphate transferase [Patescibacteria group bacterium]